MANRYFVGDIDDNWHDDNNWASVSGGAGGAGIPTSSDDVYLDGYSPNCSIYAVGADCKNLDCTGFTGTFQLTVVPGPCYMNIYGTVFKLVAGMTLSGNPDFRFKATSGTVLITTAGKTITKITIDGSGGTFRLQDNSLCQGLVVNAGTFDVNDFNLTINGVTTISGGIWQLGTGNIQVRDLTVSGSGGITRETSTMIFGAPLSTLTTITLNGQLLYHVKLNGSGGSQTKLVGNLTCYSLDLDDNNDYLNLNGYNLDVNDGDFTISAGIFDGGAGAITTRGNFYMTGGIVTMTSATWQARKDFERSAGTLSHNNGTLYMYRIVALDYDLDINGAELYNLTIEYGAYGVDVDSDFTIVAGGKLLYISARGLEGTATITLKGDFETRLSSTNFSTRCTVLVNGTGAQEISANSGTKLLAISELIIDKASGTLTFTNGLGLIANDLVIEYKQGTIDWSACTELKTLGHHATIKCTANFTIGSTVNFNADNGSFNLYVDAGILTIEGTFTATSNGTLISTNGGEVYLKGNADFLDPFGAYPGDLKFTVNGTGAQTVQSSNNNGSVTKLVIDKPSGTLTMSGTLRVSGDAPVVPQLEYIQGTVDTSALTLQIGAGANDDQRVKSTSGCVFNNVEINPNGAYDFQVEGVFVVGGKLLISDVDDINSIGGGYIEVRGDFESNDSDVEGTCTIYLRGTGTQTIKCNNGEFSNGDLVIDKNTGEAILGENFAPASWTGDLIITKGILSTGGYNITAQDLNVQANGVFKWKGNETITLSGSKTLTGTVEYYDAAVEVTLDDFATTFGGLTLGAGKTHKVTAGPGNGIVITGSFGSRGTFVNRAILRSTSDGTQWELDLQGISALGDSVDVKDSDASAGNRVNALNSENSGNNDNWFFGIGQGGFGLFRPNSLRYNRGICPKQLG